MVGRGTQVTLEMGTMVSRQVVMTPVLLELMV